MERERAIGTLGRIWRYPVKSLAGEELDRVEVQERGLLGDRQLAVYNQAGKIGSGKETRRFSRILGLLMASARTTGDGVMLSHGTETVAASDPGVHRRISAWFGRPLTLASEGQVSHFDDQPVSLLTTAALAQLGDWLGGEAVDASRFRANLLVETAGARCVEDDWVGREIAFAGGLRLAVVSRITRCVMINMESVTTRADARLLQALADHHQACLGVVARVLNPGAIQVGDELRLASAPRDRR